MAILTPISPNLGGFSNAGGHPQSPRQEVSCTSFAEVSFNKALICGSRANIA